MVPSPPPDTPEVRLGLLLLSSYTPQMIIASVLTLSIMYNLMTLKIPAQTASLDSRFSILLPILCIHLDIK